MAQTLDDLDDLTLLLRVVAREPAAFDTFFIRFENLVYACVMRSFRQSGVRFQDADVADVVAEVWLGVVANGFRKLRQYRIDRGAAVSTWIGIITASIARDHVRAARRRRSEPVAEDTLERLSPLAPCMHAELLRREERRILDEAMRTLSERDRRFAQLYYGRGLSPRHVADELGVSVATVYSKTAKLRSRLARTVRRSPRRRPSSAA
jgi:RNA polymerase sigma-70 factor (ECF subfamily)